MAALRAITSTRAPANPLSENSLRAAARMRSRVRPGSRAPVFDLPPAAETERFIRYTLPDPPSNRPVTFFQLAHAGEEGCKESHGAPLPGFRVQCSTGCGR